MRLFMLGLMMVMVINCSAKEGEKSPSEKKEGEQPTAQKEEPMNRGTDPGNLPEGLFADLQTSKGLIRVRLDHEKAPLTTANFVGYTEEGFYNGTIFHRVIGAFMIQGGGFTPDMQKKPTKQPIQNEADNGLKNAAGTIAMARTNDPHSATAQFFINTNDNINLDFRSKTQQGWGYCVFGRVIEGMEVVRAIEAVQTGVSGMYRDVPVTPVVIEKVTIIRKGEKAEALKGRNGP